MATLHFVSGRYSLGHFIQTCTLQIPQLFEDRDIVVSNLAGPAKLPGKLGIALYLRMAHLMGCPVCKAVFPRLAKSRGFSQDQIREALGGSEGFLTSEQSVAVCYGESVLRSDGRVPDDAPEGMDPRRRRQVETFVRVSMVIHALGLMFLPHQLIENSRK